MNQIPIAVLTTACFVLAVDLVTSYLRKQVRSTSGTREPKVRETESGEEPKEGVAIEQE